VSRKLVIKGKSIRRLNVTASSSQLLANDPTDNTNGRVIDGYVRNSEITIFGPDGALLGRGVSQRDGSFNIEIDRITAGVIQVVCTGGVDISTEKPFAGVLKTLTVKEENNDTISAIVTPITTLVAGVVEISDSNEVVTVSDIQAAKANIASSLNINTAEIETDFIQNKNIKVAKRSSQLATISKLTLQEISKNTSRTTAAESVRKALAEAINDSTTFNLADTGSIQQVLTKASTVAAEITQDPTIISTVAENSEAVANSIQVVTNTIDQINEETSGSTPVDPDAAIEAVALIGAVVDNIISGNGDITVVADESALVDLVASAQVFQVQSPVSSIIPPTIYPWNVQPYPILDESMSICLGGLYVTVEWLTDWKCTTGQFEPFSLASGVLKRLNNSVAGAVQPITLQQGDWLVLDVGGLSRITFIGGEIRTASGAIFDTQIVTGSKVIQCISSPTSILVEMMDSVDELTNISLISSITNEEMINNGDFTSLESRYYELDGWYLDQDDPTAIDPYSIGVVTGFLEDMKYTMFSGPVTVLE
jgi:hypothetical protein